MRKVQAFLLSLTICYGGKSCRVDAFNVATTEKRCSLIRRHVGISHDVPEDFALQNNNIATPPTRLTGDDVSDKSSKPAPSTLNPLEAAFTKYAMISYVAHMCIALPMVLLPTFIKNELMTRLKLKTKAESEDEALKVSQKCANTLLKLIPFMNLEVVSSSAHDENPVPTIWVSNHLSMLDTFVFLSSDEEIRGKNRRPIKTIYVSKYRQVFVCDIVHLPSLTSLYIFILHLPTFFFVQWKGLDSNPICKLVFSMAGFIPVDMADNGNGNPNEYKKASFKKMLREIQLALVLS